jgi:hypothetical protein
MTSHDAAMSEKHSTWRELSAVPVVLVISAIVLAMLSGEWIGPWGAAIVTVGFALAVIAGLTVWSARRTHPPAADAPDVTPIDDRRYRILVVAGDRWQASRSIDELRSHGGGRPVSVFVTAPALESTVGRLTGDQDSYDDAARRLKVTLDALRGAGFRAQGAVGPNDPLQAADDGMRRFRADEVVFVTHPQGPTNWVEHDVIARARSRYETPVKHIAVQ